MSCQNTIKTYIKRNIEKDLSDLLDYTEFIGEYEPKFKVISRFDFKKYFNDSVKRAEDSFSKKYTKSDSIGDNIFSIITSNKYSKKGNYSKEVKEELHSQIRDKINNSIRKKEKIGLVIPGFTTKAFNLLRVESRRLPDLAEFASLVRLYEICYQIGKVYPHGAEFVVVTDGLAYARIFGEDTYFAEHHRTTMEQWMRKLGIETTVKLVDLTTLLPVDFRLKYKKNAKKLYIEWMNRDNIADLADFVANTKNLVNYEKEIMLDIDLFYKFQDDHGQKKLDRKKINNNIVRKALRTSFKYEAFLTTMYQLRVINDNYKGHIRCTGRPKPGQLGIHMLHKKTENFPWNGVGVIRKNGRVDVKPESIVKYSDKYRAVFIEGDHSAFYYEEM